MNITFAPRGISQIDDARIIYRNFRGEGGKFNREETGTSRLLFQSRRLQML